jgi:hypothetical protein
MDGGVCHVAHHLIRDMHAEFCYESLDEGEGYFETRTCWWLGNTKKTLKKETT